MPARNPMLPDHEQRFIEQQLAARNSQDASEVLRAGLRLLEQQFQFDEQKLAKLKKLATAGFESLNQGQTSSLASDKHLAEASRQLGRRAAKTVAPQIMTGTDCSMTGTDCSSALGRAGFENDVLHRLPGELVPQSPHRPNDLGGAPIRSPSGAR